MFKHFDNVDLVRRGSIVPSSHIRAELLIAPSACSSPVRSAVDEGHRKMKFGSYAAGQRSDRRDGPAVQIVIFGV